MIFFKTSLSANLLYVNLKCKRAALKISFQLFDTVQNHMCILVNVYTDCVLLCLCGYDGEKSSCFQN